MKTILKVTSFAGLAVMLASAGAVFAGAISRGTYYWFALGGTLAWFGTVPFWMKRRLRSS